MFVQQTSLRNPERVLLLPPGQPLPQRRGQGGAGKEMRNHSLAGTKDLLFNQGLQVLFLKAMLKIYISQLEPPQNYNYPLVGQQLVWK